MADESLGPDYLTTRGIPTSRRGYDKRVVDAVLSEAREHWQALLDKYEELYSAVEASGGIEYLTRELSEVGSDVGEVLASAQRAAEGIRVRAREEAERLEQEASQKSEALVAEAEQQAFDLRSDAWEGGMDLLESTEVEAERIIKAAKDDALVIRAQAEKDGHRHISGAEREASDLIRQARYEADRQLNQARELAQQIIDRAAQPDGDQGDAAVGETAAKRDELLDDIERIRLERSIDSVAVFENDPKPEPEPARPAEPEPDPGGIDLSDLLAADVEELRSDPIGPSSAVPRPVPPRRAEAQPDQFGTDDDVGTLFEALRTTGEQEPVRTEEQLPSNPFELKDQLLLPIINEGSRDSKRRIVDLQNEALAGLRGGGWVPDPPTIAKALRLGLESMILKAASAGATAAGPLAGLRGSVADPGERAGGLVVSMSAALAGQLSAELEDAGGPEQAAEAVSRVFRVWRNDDAARWVGTIASAAYHDSLISALRDGEVEKIEAVSNGPACDECPAPTGQSWRPGREPPDDTKLPRLTPTPRAR